MHLYFRDWNVPENQTCVDDLFLYVLNKVIKEKKFNVQVKRMTRCDPYCILKVGYFPADCRFTYIHLDKDGNLAAFEKKYVKKLVFERYAEGKRKEDNEPYIASPGYKEKALIFWLQHARVLPDTGSQDYLDNEIRIKWGAAVKATCEEMDDKTLSLLCDALADEIKMMFADKYKVQVSDKPSEIYTKKSNFKSCMIDCRPERFEIYDIVPSIKIAYIINGDILQARALLIESTYYRKPIILMDRIYYADSLYLAAMKKWAVDNGYWYKTSQSLHWDVYTNGKGATKKFSSMRIPTGDICFRFIELPYIDTFYRFVHDLDKDEYYLTMQRGKGRHLADIQYASSKAIPTVLRDKHAHSCQCCTEVHRDKDLVERAGYSYYFTEGQKSTVCQKCAEKMTLCEVCGKHYVYKDEKFSQDSHSSHHTGYNVGGKLVCRKCKKAYGSEWT